MLLRATIRFYIPILILHDYFRLLAACASPGEGSRQIFFFIPCPFTAHAPHPLARDWQKTAQLYRQFELQQPRAGARSPLLRSERRNYTTNPPPNPNPIPPLPTDHCSGILCAFRGGVFPRDLGFFTSMLNAKQNT